MKEQIRVTNQPIDPVRMLASVRDRSAGGIVIFVGTVRNRSEGRAVAGLEYEVYKVMAEKKMREISENARSRWPVKKISMVHRYGALDVGEISVAVAVSSEHRAEAFQACRYAIDTVKRALPIWKKEKFKGGVGAWVEGTPIES